MNRLFDIIRNSTTINNFGFTKNVVGFTKLKTTDLSVETLYKGGNSIKDEAISNMLECANMGGLRYRGSIKNSISEVDYIVLYSTLTESDRPDYFITPASLFMYYGDNRSGLNLLDTPKKGNQVLKGCFDALYEGRRNDIPPIFVFIRGEGGAIFKGVAVPGASGLDITNALIKVETDVNNISTINYKATFTILNIEKVSRKWIDDILNKNVITKNTPKEYQEWREKGIYIPLKIK